MQNEKRKKILIALADVGNGHRSAANALLKTMEEMNIIDKYEVKVVDLFEVADVQPFNSSNETYTLVSKNKTFEAFNNTLFRAFNTSVGYDLFYWYTMTFMLKECTAIIEGEAPDLIITVHPIVNMIVNEVKKKTGSKFKTVTVITDLVTLFKGWADTRTDLTSAPTERAYKLLLEWGLDKEKIIYPLFPINPSISKFAGVKETMSSLGFQNDLPLITLTGGGVGTYSLKKAMDIIKARQDCNVLVICGKSQSLYSEFTERFSSYSNIKIVGYVNNIQDYFNASEIIIGKPGPATILEIEIFNKKAILTRPVGQQEKGNVDYALDNKNFRYINENWDILDKTISELLAQKIEATSRRSVSETETILTKSLALIDPL